MRRVLLVSVLTLCCALVAQAQEFKLRISLSVDGSVWPKPVYLGYDPLAADSLTKPGQWPMPEYPEGEVLIPPAGPGSTDMRMIGMDIDSARNAILQDGTYIDIRPKPSSDRFELQYELSLTSDAAQNLKLSWDPNSIPSIVKHVYLKATQVKYTRLDMKTSSEFSIPLDSFKFLLYSRLILTVLYNQDSLGVAESTSGDAISVYPTVLERNTSAYVQAAKDGEYALELIDAVGRRVANSTLTLSAGTNRLPVSFTDRPSGTYTLVFRELHSGVIRTCKLIVD